MSPSATNHTKERKERLTIPEEGKKFLKTVFHHHRVLWPSQDEKEHVLRELQRVVPDCQQVTVKMLSRWFRDERDRTGGQTPSLTGSKKCRLEVWFSENPNPQEDVIAQWADQLDAEPNDVVYWVRHKQVDLMDCAALQPVDPLSGTLDSVAPPPPEQVELNTAIHKYNQYTSNTFPPETDEDNTLFPTSEIDASTHATDNDIQDAPQDSPNMEAESLLTWKLKSFSDDKKMVLKMMFTLASAGIDKLIATREQRKMNEVAGRTVEYDVKRCAFRTAQDVEDLFRPCETLHNEVMQLVDRECKRKEDSNKIDQNNDYR